MSFVSKIGSALGKLITVGLLMAAFLAGMTYVVYRSLQGNEVAVPEIVGKNFSESERELESLGLKIKKRADRYSEEPPNTVLEQIPRPGETVKTGQMILVVISKPNAEGDEKPTTIKKGNQSVDEDDSKKIEELISDQPKKKSNSNVNTNKKKGATTRDIIKDNSNVPGNSSDSNKDTKADTDGSTKEDKSGTPSKSPSTTTTPKPNTVKTPDSANRPRRTP